MSLEPLLEIVQQAGPVQPWRERNEHAFEALLGTPDGRYPADAKNEVSVRAPPIDEDGVPFAAYIHHSNAGSGKYGGMSVAIFPVADAPCLITFVAGTNGLAPDEHILARPGHARKLQGICTWLNREFGHAKRIAWAKQDPVRTDLPVPNEVVADFEPYRAVFKRYGGELYAIAASEDPQASTNALTAFLDLMFEERGFRALSKFRSNADELHSSWMRYVLPNTTLDDVAKLLLVRRFVVLQGPPGTGKTRMAQQLIREQYEGRGETVQFHANTTYENVIGGLAPVQSAAEVGLRFAPLRGYLMEAAAKAAADTERRYLLHLDELNRADLAKVLGEALYLLEYDADAPRDVALPYSFGAPFENRFSLPANLDIVGTMNTADRSLALVDVAVRRRFGFVDLWPQYDVVCAHSGSLMQKAFLDLTSIFLEYADEDSFRLMPGHSYFLERKGIAPGTQLATSLAPLLREYLAQGYVAGFAEAIRSYLQWLDAVGDQDGGIG